LAKIDKSQFSKKEWKQIREQRRRQKELQAKNSHTVKTVKENYSEAPQLESAAHNSKNYIVCLKHGAKYDAKYVNTLYNMISRNCTVPHEFVCFTENSEGLDQNITVKPLPSIPRASGWWYKPMFFAPNFELKGTILYFDLDVIIFKNIDNLFSYSPKRFCILKDFNRSIRSSWKKFNSSVFRLESGAIPHVYNDFIADPASAIRRFHGDQDWIFDRVREGFEYWPDEWIQSYKWEMRGRPAMVRDRSGKRNFGSPGEPKILPNTSVAVFHGEPNPHDCIDPWCKRNWK